MRLLAMPVERYEPGAPTSEITCYVVHDFPLPWTLAACGDVIDMQVTEVRHELEAALERNALPPAEEIGWTVVVAKRPDEHRAAGVLAKAVLEQRGYRRIWIDYALA